jgi:hypothetical protein
MNSGFRIRVDENLRKRFIDACRAKDRTASQVIRDFMRNYVDPSLEMGQQQLFQNNDSNEFKGS